MFFVTIGMGLDASRLLEAPGPILARRTGPDRDQGASSCSASDGLSVSRRPVAAETALLLGPGGEFSFVIMGGAMAAGLVPAGIGQDVLLVTTLTMVAIPALARLGRRLEQKA